MTLYQKVRSVERLFKELDSQVATFQAKSGLHCIPGCGKCCFKPDIEATILELLPLAYHFYKAGIIDEVYEKLKENNSGICHIFVAVSPSTGKGYCSEYPKRPLVCRLFGFSARKNRYGVNELYTCRLIKKDQRKLFEEASDEINGVTSVPMVAEYSHRLASIDPTLGREYYPMNDAAKRAIEIVISYYAYRVYSRR
ncbi:MAG TPA: YkgJ family cysteine cluster protein [Cyclobacteriaceae bacterium]|nr:YkgJ family cysteine cluster protein [Cyclobacteriaceae bacterium]